MSENYSMEPLLKISPISTAKGLIEGGPMVSCFVSVVNDACFIVDIYLASR